MYLFKITFDNNEIVFRQTHIATISKSYSKAEKLFNDIYPNVTILIIEYIGDVAVEQKDSCKCDCFKID